MSRMCTFMFISDYFPKIHVKIQPWNKGVTFPIFISHFEVIAKYPLGWLSGWGALGLI